MPDPAVAVVAPPLAPVSPGATPGVRAVHFTLQGKGGVGKSLVSSLLAQYFKRAGGPVHCVDTDPVNQTFSNYKALQASHVRILAGARIDERAFDQLMERLLHEDGIFVVDNGASSFIPLSNYLIENDAIAMLADAGRDVFIHCIVTGGQGMVDTMAGLDALATQTSTTNLVVWLNEFFGPIEHNGKGFEQSRVYLQHQTKIRGIVRIPRRNPDTFGRDIEDMSAAHLTFDEVFESPRFSIMAKQRLKTVQREVDGQLDLLQL